MKERAITVIFNGVKKSVHVKLGKVQMDGSIRVTASFGHLLDSCSIRPHDMAIGFVNDFSEQMAKDFINHANLDRIVKDYKELKSAPIHCAQN